MVSRRRIGTLLLALLVAGGLPGAGFAQDQRLLAQVDRSSVRENESFNYTLRAEGRFAGRPDLSALGQDFDVLNTFRSSSFEVVNGRTTQFAEFVVSLMPRGTGTFELPSIELDGVKSNTVSVEVLPASAADSQSEDIFIEVEVDRTNAYVLSQVIYTLRLYTYVGVATGQATLTSPLVEGGEAIIERLGSDARYDTVRGGNRFNVIERSYAIFPQSAGTLTIGPAVFEALMQQNRGLARTIRLRSDVVELAVLPAVPPPPEYPDAVWLPASGLELEESWSDSATAFAQGVPQTRTLTISAGGVLETQLPELALAPSPGLRQYPDQPDLRRETTNAGILATRTERYAVIAQQPGAVELPAVELPWWNVDEERWEVARIDGRSVEVRADQSAAPPAPEATPTTTVERVEQTPGLWPWLSAALAAGWLVTLAAWAWRARGGSPRARPAVRAERPLSSRQLLKQLIAAARVDDRERTRELLLRWAARQFPDTPPLNLGALAGSLSGPLAAEIEGLEAALYGPQTAEWRGQRLAELLQRTQSIARSGADDDEDPLVPLYR